MVWRIKVRKSYLPLLENTAQESKRARAKRGETGPEEREEMVGGEKRPFPPTHTPTRSPRPGSRSQVSPEVRAGGSRMGPERRIPPPEPKKQV